MNIIILLLFLASGRPVRADSIELDSIRLVPRFGVVQGTDHTGNLKIRAVDHFSWSSKRGQKRRSKREMKAESVNGHFESDCTVCHDHLDDLLEAMKAHKTLFDEVLIYGMLCHQLP